MPRSTNRSKWHIARSWGGVSSILRLPWTIQSILALLASAINVVLTFFFSVFFVFLTTARGPSF